MDRKGRRVEVWVRRGRGEGGAINFVIDEGGSVRYRGSSKVLGPVFSFFFFKTTSLNFMYRRVPFIFIKTPHLSLTDVQTAVHIG